MAPLPTHHFKLVGLPTMGEMADYLISNGD
ncbi:hypothetical protein MCEPAE42_00481 [Candidatus Nanopelagicaceae bacterium]